MSLVQPFFNELFDVFINFLYAPIIFPETLMILAPLLLTSILMELYFAEYPRRTIGHHRALENTIFLIFVAANLIYWMIMYYLEPIKIVLIILFLIFWVIVGVLDFLHKLPTNLIFGLSSKFFITYSAYVAIVFVYTGLLDNLSILRILSLLISMVFVFVIVAFVKYLMSGFEPKSYEEIEHFLKEVEKDIEKASEEIDEEGVIEKISEDTDEGEKNIENEKIEEQSA